LTNWALDLIAYTLGYIGYKQSNRDLD